MKEKSKLFLFIVFGILAIFYLSAFAGTEKSELIFSHKLHIVENEIECSTCHSTAEESISGKDNLMPTMETCGDCHDIEAEESCGTCHSDLENPRNVPRIENYFPQFSHQLHLASELECISCHSGMRNMEVVEPYILPVIENCQECHLSKKVKPKTHGPNYLHVHADDSKSELTTVTAEQTCKTCHSVQYCQNCHEGDNLDRTTHPLNYAYTHSLDAMGKERECSACHVERSFCIECHQQNFVLPHNHTAGWANRIDGGRHSVDAKNDLESCMSCHEQDAQRVCQKCHSK